MPGPKVDRSKYTLGSPQSKKRLKGEAAATAPTFSSLSTAAGKLGRTASRKAKRQQVRKALTTVRKAYRKSAVAGGSPRSEGGTTWTPSEAATLAHKVGASPQEAKLLSTKVVGESGGNPKAVGNDPGGTTGLGLWQITTGYNDDVINKYGGQRAMMKPRKNAKAAVDILRRQGIGAWYAPSNAPGKIKKTAPRNPRQRAKVREAKQTLRQAGVKPGQRASTPKKQKPKSLWRGPKAPIDTGQLTPEQAAVTGAVRKLGKKIAGLSGEKVELISGVRPGAVTTSGNVSDHSSGNALDIHALDQTPSGGGTAQDKARGDRIAKAAMVAAGISRKEADGYIAGDGPVEVNTYHNGYRVQILWRTDTGGNHHNHVHVGIRAEDGSGTSAVSGGVGGALAPSGGSTKGGTSVRSKRRSEGRAAKKRKLSRVRSAYSSPAESDSGSSELDELEKRYSAAI